MDYSLPGSSVQGILQARILDWVAISSSRGSSQPRDRTCVSCVGRWIFLPLSHLGVFKIQVVQNLGFAGRHTGYESCSTSYQLECLTFIFSTVIGG